jgi:hypothetical protein
MGCAITFTSPWRSQRDVNRPAAVNSGEATHLTKRDRLALGFRILGAVSGFAIIGVAFATSSWSNGWVLGLLAVIIIGGALSYHLLTSIVGCPSCSNWVFNFRIGSEDEKRKSFSCRHCGVTAWLAEGFYWQQDISG